MKKRLALAAFCLGLSILPCYSDVKKEKSEDEIRKEQIAEEDTSSVLEDSITEVVGKDFVGKGAIKSITRFLTVIPDEPLDEEPYYGRSASESIVTDISNEFTKDPLFYDWRTGEMFNYRDGNVRSFMWRGNVLSGLGRATIGELKTLRKKQTVDKDGNLVDSKMQLIGRTVGWGDGFVRKLKNITEWRPSYRGHELTVRPEMDLEGSLGFYWEVESPRVFVDGWEFRYESGEAALGKDVKLGPFQKLIFDAAYDPSNSENEEEILGRFTYKNSFIGFNSPKKSEKDLEAERIWAKEWNDRQWSRRVAEYERSRIIKVKDMTKKELKRQDKEWSSRLVAYEKGRKVKVRDMSPREVRRFEREMREYERSAKVPN
ncbi:hypothetical protein CMI41_00170 [Candidatus Pacearchaeota archaeon]|nr:hypothetical protein [Candidatus Pacearchaeota archaeon]